MKKLRYVLAATEQSARGSHVKLVTGSERHSDTTSTRPTTRFSYEHERPDKPSELVEGTPSRRHT